MKRFQECRGCLFRLEYDAARREFVSVPVDFPFSGAAGHLPAAAMKKRAKIMALKTSGGKRVSKRKPSK